MRVYKVLIFLIFSFFSKGICAQQYVNFTIVQPDSLIADAGIDVSVSNGNPVLIGGNPIAYGGITPYIQFWEPGIFLNDSTLANPVVTSSCSMEFILTVKDANNCSSKDTVFINVATGNTFINPDIKDNKPTVVYKPESNIISICFENTHSSIENFNIIITDISGKTLYKKLTEPYKNPTINIPTNNFSDLILVSIKGAQKEWSYKLVTGN